MINRKAQTCRQQGGSVAVVWGQGTAVYVVGEVLANLLTQALCLKAEETIPPSDPPVFQLRQIGERLVLVNNEAQRDLPGADARWGSPRMSRELTRAGLDRRERAGHRSWTIDR